MASQRLCSVCVHCSERFLTDENAVYPDLGQSSDIYSTTPVYGDVTGFQTKEAERIVKPCLECSLSFQMSFVLHIQGLLKSQHPPCQGMLQETPIPSSRPGSWELSLILVRWLWTTGRGWKNNITNNTASGRKSVDSPLKAPDYVVY